MEFEEQYLKTDNSTIRNRYLRSKEQDTEKDVLLNECEIFLQSIMSSPSVNNKLKQQAYELVDKIRSIGEDE